MAVCSCAMVDVLQIPASCLCKKVRFLAPVERGREWLACHCPDCRQAHGAAWVPLVPLAIKGQELHGEQGSLKEGPLSMCSALAGTVNAEVKRHFCQACGSTCLVSLHMEGKVRCSLLPAGVLCDKAFPKDFSPKLKDCGTESPAPFGPLSGIVLNSAPEPPILGSCLCGSCRFRTLRLPREMQHCHCSMCRQMSGAAYQTWTPVPKTEIEWLKPNSLKVIRASRDATREFCEACGSALTIMYSGQRGTVWLSAAAYDKAAFAGMCSKTLRSQSMHICCDSAPPWHPLRTWAYDGVKRIRDVCEESPDVSFDEALAEDSEDEEYQLQQALQISRFETEGMNETQGFSSSSSSKSRFNPELALLQEITRCSLLEAEQALAAYGSADAAAEALLSSKAQTSGEESNATVPSLPDDPPAKKAKTSSDWGSLPVWRGELGQKLTSISECIDLD